MASSRAGECDVRHSLWHDSGLGRFGIFALTRATLLLAPGVARQSLSTHRDPGCCGLGVPSQERAGDCQSTGLGAISGSPRLMLRNTRKKQQARVQTQEQAAAHAVLPWFGPTVHRASTCTDTCQRLAGECEPKGRHSLWLAHVQASAMSGTPYGTTLV